MKTAPALRALAAAAILAAAGCERPPDEAWLRFVGFRSGDKNITVVEGKLRDKSTDYADAAFENATVQVGGGSGSTGTGILVGSARVEYTLGSSAPPVFEYPLALYLAAPKSGEATSGTVSDLPVVPAALKAWIIASGLTDGDEVRLTARVTFTAKTDDNNPLEVGGSVSVVLADEGGGEAAPVVSVAATDAQAEEDPLGTGLFTVSRAGSTAAALAVSYALATGEGHATNGTDYQTLGGSVAIPAGSAAATITVTPIADSAAEEDETVVLTLGSGAGYRVGTPRSATVTITD